MSDAPPFAPMPPAPDPAHAEAAARQQVNVPAILLILVGVLNALLALGSAGMGVMVRSIPDDKLEEILEQQKEKNPPLREALEKWTIEDIRRLYDTIFFGSAAPLLFCIFIILAGVRMRQLRSYGLVVTGAILAALPIPCLSCAGCCGAGEVAGIWALIVLFNPAVKSMFH